MEKLYEYLKGDEWVVIFTTIISLYAAIVMFFMTYIKSKMHRRKSKWVEAYDLILKGIEQKTLASNDDVFLIYKQLVQNYSANSSYVDFLESLLIYVRKTASDRNVVINVTNRITPILEKEREEKPYTNINDRERRILQSIDDAAKRREFGSIQNNLRDLSLVIQSNQQDLRRARTTNNWTVPISIIGVLLTLFIWLYGSSLSERDIERISTHISNTISEQVIVEQPDSVSSSLTKIDQ